MGIRIDALDAAASAADGHELPAMSGGATVKLTVAQISTKVRGDLSGDLALKAPLESPAFTGNPTAPTPAGGDNDASIATTAYVQGELAINPLTAKTTPVDVDLLRLADSAASFAPKKLTFANLWAWIQAKVLTLFNAGGNAPVFSCRAWVNFNGTGTVAIRASGNVSSITDNGTGDYTVNFTTALPDANYSIAGNSNGTVGVIVANDAATARTASLVRISQVQGNTGAVADASIINLAVFR